MGSSVRSWKFGLGSVDSELGVCSPNLECEVRIWREESLPEQPNLGGFMKSEVGVESELGREVRTWQCELVSYELPVLAQGTGTDILMRSFRLKRPRYSTKFLD